MSWRAPEAECPPLYSILLASSYRAYIASVLVLSTGNGVAESLSKMTIENPRYHSSGTELRSSGRLPHNVMHSLYLPPRASHSLNSLALVSKAGFPRMGNKGDCLEVNEVFLSIFKPTDSVAPMVGCEVMSLGSLS